MTWTDITVEDEDSRTVGVSFTEIGGNITVDIEAGGQDYSGCTLTEEQVSRLISFFTRLGERR